MMAFLCSCSYSIKRTGYTTPTPTNTECDVKVVFEKPDIADSLLVFKGEIMLRDGGFTSHCKEADAMALLKKEACALEANTVEIVQFKKPDIMSTCYQCTAKFYKSTLQNVTDSTQNTVVENSKKEREVPPTNAGGMLLGYLAGFALGFILVSLIL